MMDYKTIGKALQIEGNRTNVDVDFVESQGFSSQDTISRIDGVALFNKIADKNDLQPLLDPVGYMTLDGNIYDSLRESYTKNYNKAIESIESNMMDGGSQGMKAVLKNAPKIIRHDITPFVPDDMKYSELRFVRSNPRVESTIEDFVNTRVRLTHAFGIKRSVDETARLKLQDDLKSHGERLKHDIAIAAGLEEAPRKLSSKTMLENAKNNKDGFDKFSKQLVDPDKIDKGDNDQHATASFQTKDLPLAKFVLANKKYLESFGFEISKVSGQVQTTWQSPSVDAMYESRKESEVKLDLSDMDGVGMQR